MKGRSCAVESLIDEFMDRYLARGEIIHRLPINVSIGQFWPELVKERRSRAQNLPLLSQNGEPLWFVQTAGIERQCNAVAAMARRDVAFDGPEFDKLFEDAVVDEAVYSSVIEGAFTSREQAAAFIHGAKSPRNKSEQMVKNNYDALTYVLEHLDDEIDEGTIIEIAKIVTRSAAEVKVEGYRTDAVYVTGRDEIVYTPPRAQDVPRMMRALIEFIQKSELHPLLKVCIAHFYLVYIHPFGDGNGRTARALSIMMLLKSGYDFFRYFAVSGIVAKERGKYYRSMRNVEDSDGDMTYFIDAYSDMLARTVDEMEHHLRHHVYAAQRLKSLEANADLNERQLKGAKWLLEGDMPAVTTEDWRRKYKVATETARRDLMTLCECGVLVRQVKGRKAVFCLVRDI